jgi:hypothetical protein
MVYLGGIEAGRRDGSLSVGITDLLRLSSSKVVLDLEAVTVASDDLPLVCPGLVGEVMGIGSVTCCCEVLIRW